MVTKAVKESEIEQANWHWRNTMRTVRFFNLDARAALPFFILLVYARPITLFLTLLITAVFWFLERKGLSFPSALRALRVWLIGERRPAWITYRRRRMHDYG
jgi:intracellular multiplication protein IcmT